MRSIVRDIIKKLERRLVPQRVDLGLERLRQNFDPKFYHFLDPSLENLSESQMFDHFVGKGLAEGRDPNAEFSSAAYLQMYSDVGEALYNPYLHYLRHGEVEKRVARLSSWGHPISDPLADTQPVSDLPTILRQFDAKFYRNTNRELAALSDRALAAHFIVLGWKEGRNPRADFSVEGYLELNRDIAEAGHNPFLHFILFGANEGRKYQSAKISRPGSSPPKSDMAAVAEFFDADYYRRMNADVQGSDEQLIAHFMNTGWKEGRDPSAEFSTSFYLEEYADIASARINPLLHYAVFGKTEGRKPRGGQQIQLAMTPEADLVPDHLSSIMVASSQNPTAPAAPAAVNPKAMTIHWVVPDFSRGGGGHMTIFRMVRHLEAFGHRCRIWIEKPVTHTTTDDAYQMIVKEFQCVGAEVAFVEDGFFEATGDAVIATAWSTAYLVNAAQNFAAKYYFVQDHEPEFYPTGAESLLARQSYFFDLACICASPWLDQMMQQRYGRWARYFHLACDHNLYRIPSDANHLARFADPMEGPFKIVVYARDHSPRRCVSLALMALQILRRSRDDFEVHLFGQDKLPFSSTSFPAFNYGVLDAEQLAALYNDCHLGICFSATNYSLVPQEMMACGLPLIELDNDSTRAIFPDGVTTLAGPDPHDIAAHIGRLMDAPQVRQDQAAAALDWVQGLSWETAARRVETAIVDYISETHNLTTPAITTGRDILLDVVIPTYNGIGQLELVIEALRGQHARDRIQIHCIDSSSGDGTTEWLRAQTDVALTVIDQKDFQHGRTRNQGAAGGRAPFIAFLTQDALPATTFWANDILQMMRHYPDAAGLFGRHLPYPHHSQFVREQINKHFANILEYPLALSKHTDPERWNSGDQGWRQILHYYSDNNSAMRRSVWTEIPYPKIDYGEDQVWARDIIEAGYTKLYAPTATVYHSHDYNPDETYVRSKIESAFFSTHFGYRLGDGKDAEIARRIEDEQRQILQWARRQNLPADEIDKLQANVKARHHGWRDGLKEAGAAR